MQQHFCKRNNWNIMIMKQSQVLDTITNPIVETTKQMATNQARWFLIDNILVNITTPFSPC